VTTPDPRGVADSLVMDWNIQRSLAPGAQPEAGLPVIEPRNWRSFPFINANPGSATERSHSRFLVRSHVGSWIWQQTKRNSGASDTDEVDDSHAQGVKRSMHRANWDSIEFEATTSTTPLASLTIGCQTPDLATGQTSTRRHDDNDLDLLRSSNAPELSPSGLYRLLYSTDYISIGTLDPFQMYPSNFPPAFVNWAITYCEYHSFLYKWATLQKFLQVYRSYGLASSPTP
jgi:hypothetical protein